MLAYILLLKARYYSINKKSQEAKRLKTLINYLINVEERNHREIGKTKNN